MADLPNQDPSLLADFVTESGELIESVDQDLVALEHRPGDPDLLNRIFRALHTIKGASSFLALDPLTHFAHAGEDALNALRKGNGAVDASVMDMLLQAVDIIRDQIASVEAGCMPEEGPVELAGKLRAVGSGSTPTVAPAGAGIADAGPGPALDLPEAKRDLLPFMVDDLDAGLQQVRVLMGECEAAGDVRHAATQLGDVTSGLVRAADFFGVEALTAELQTLDHVADVLADLPADRRVGIAARVEPLLTVVADRGKALRGCRLLAADSTGVRDAIDRHLAGESAPEAPEEAAEAPEPAEDRRLADRRTSERRAADRGAGGERTVRVDVERLESLLNLVGELVLQKNRVLGLAKTAQRSRCDQELRDQLVRVGSEIERVTSDLQTGVMKTRMQPLSKLFNRYPRLIRDLARQLDKTIDLQIEGGETEVDKSVIEALGDPLVHILRNSGDHGVEPPDEREAAGKPRKGVIHLAARHEGNHVLVQVTDDGRGLDADKLGRKAVERGLITEDQRQAMSERELQSLIFEPGFSTAGRVSDVSGRGVGMDVVRTNIARLNGMIDLDSKKGAGTALSIRIPLTVAIMPAMVVEVSGEVYAIPLNNITEIIRPGDHAITPVGGQPVMRVRDQVLPVLDMTGRLGARASGNRPPIAVIVGLGEKQMALLVTGLFGQEEVVIKPLDDGLERDASISGATIREDGSVCLIMDVAALFKSLESRPKAA